MATRGWMGGASQTATGAWPETSPIRFSETPFKRLPCSLAFKCHKTRHLAAVCQVAHSYAPKRRRITARDPSICPSGEEEYAGVRRERLEAWRRVQRT